MKRLGLFILLSLTVASAHGATRYVSDELEITLRSGPTTQHRITRMLTSGTPVEVVETTEDGWAHIQLGNGADGWVLTRYLMNTPSARNRLEQATANLAQARAEVAELRKALESERGQRTAAESKISTLSASGEEMQRQLAEAERGLTMAAENKTLKQQIADLEYRIQELKYETERLSDRNERSWFVTGAGVVGGGFLAGIVVTRIRWRRKSSWGDL